MIWLAPFALLPMAAVLSFVASRWLTGVARSLSLLGVQGICIAAPFTLPPQHTLLRFSAAVAVVVCIVRSWEVRRNVHPEPARRRFGHFFSYFLMLPDIRFCFDDECRQKARARGRRKLLEAGSKGGLLLLTLVISTLYPALFDQWVLATLWALWAAYFASSGMADALAGTAMLATGHDGAEVFWYPVVARSPRDFWSRRWNLVFRNSAHRLIFVPLGGRRRPLGAVAVVFLWSVLVHEYLVVAALGYTGGHMAAFFALHGVATMLDAFVRRPRLARWLAVALHLCWLVLTAPLFFAPLWEITQVASLSLW